MMGLPHSHALSSPLSSSPSPSPGILSRRTSQTGGGVAASYHPPRSIVSTSALPPLFTPIQPILPVPSMIPPVLPEIMTDVIFELSIPAPAIVTGQCHMMYGFPEEIMQLESQISQASQKDEYIKDFAICAATPTESPEIDEHARHVRRTASGRTCYAERFSELRDQEQAARYYELLRRIRRRSRSSNVI